MTLPSVAMTEDGSTFKQSGADESGKENWRIPMPPPRNASKRKLGRSSSSTPLLSTRQRRNNVVRSRRTGVERAKQFLFGEQVPENTGDDSNTDFGFNDGRPKGLAGFFFSFMYEEPFNDSIEYDDEDTSTASSVWNPLNIALFVAYTLTSAATTVPILLVPVMGQEFLSEAANGEASAFTSRAASSAVLGAACGKFLNGPIIDVLGARRSSVFYSFMLSLSLLGLTFCGDTQSAAWTCYFVEFFQSVQWPCIIVMLATHYAPHNHAMYEGGIYVTSIASRLGSLLGIPFFSILLRTSHWRVVCLVGAWIAMIGSSVAYLFLADSPNRVNEPQNELHPHLLHQIETADFRQKPRRCLRTALHIIHTILVDNMLPSLQHVLKSGTFWIVALAHTGSSMVRTSEKILGTYFHDTSMGYLSEDRAGELSVFLSFGTILGLAIAGNMFAHRKERQRKWLVSRLYMITIGACYCLAILAIPRLRYLMDAPGLVLFFQVVSSTIMGFGIAVMFSMIPGLVGSAFGKHKGLFSSYTDGVGYGLASVVWKIVANAVAGGADGGGWAYGWAAVALLIILCAILMTEFMEHYFVRAQGKHHGTYETIIFA